MEPKTFRSFAKEFLEAVEERAPECVLKKLRDWEVDTTCSPSRILEYLEKACLGGYFWIFDLVKWYMVKEDASFPRFYDVGALFDELARKLKDLSAEDAGILLDGMDRSIASVLALELTDRRRSLWYLLLTFCEAFGEKRKGLWWQVVREGFVKGAGNKTRPPSTDDAIREIRGRIADQRRILGDGSTAGASSEKRAQEEPLAEYEKAKQELRERFEAERLRLEAESAKLHAAEQKLYSKQETINRAQSRVMRMQKEVQATQVLYESQREETRQAVEALKESEKTLADLKKMFLSKKELVDRAQTSMTADQQATQTKKQLTERELLDLEETRKADEAALDAKHGRRPAKFAYNFERRMRHLLMVHGNDNVKGAFSSMLRETHPDLQGLYRDAENFQLVKTRLDSWREEREEREKKKRKRE